MQIGGRRRAAFAITFRVVALRDLVQANPFVVATVEVVACRDAGLLRGFYKGMRDRSRALLVGDVQRSGSVHEYMRC